MPTASKRKREDGSEEEIPEQGGGLGLSSLWSMIPSFGTILMIGIVMVGLAFGAQAGWFGEDIKNKASEILGGLADSLGFGNLINGQAAKMPLAEFQQKMRDKGTPESFITEFAGTEERRKETVDAIGEAGGNMLNPTSAKAISALVLKYPDRLQKAVAGMSFNPGAMTEAQKAAAAKLAGSFKEIVAGDALDTMLTTKRATTLPLILHFSPYKIDAAKLSPLIDKIALGADGKATQGFRDLLTSLLTLKDDGTPDTAASTEALLTFLKSQDPKNIHDLALCFDLKSMPGGAVKSFLQGAIANPQGALAQVQTAQALSSNGVGMNAMEGLMRLAQDPQKLADRLLMDAPTRRALMQPDVTAAIGALLQQTPATGPGQKQFMAFATAQKDGHFVNLEATLGLLETLATNPYNIAGNGRVGQRTLNVVHGLMRVAGAKSEPEQRAMLAAIDGTQLSDFLRDPVNSRAFDDFNGKLLNPPALLREMHKQWGKIELDKPNHIDTKKSEGLAELLSDPGAVNWLLAKMRAPGGGPMNENLVRVYLVAQGGTLSANRDELVALMQTTGAIAPSPLPQAVRVSGRFGG